ncbi:MAG: 30S ribosomal protein S16 [Bacteroidetes bacterium]|nr:30S ribosomal protein S16 [Bacteroidota bacterium]
MPTKIRLQRRGKKGQPYYHIVIADGRAPRDGKFIERIGIYNPLPRPAEIELNIDKALAWLQKGAQPTDTVRSIFSFKGVLYKYHLLKGVNKGALTPEMAEVKFQEWQDAKQVKISGAIKEEELKVKDSRKKALSYETSVNEAKANAIAVKLAKEREAQKSAAEAAHEAKEAAALKAAAPHVEAPQAETPQAEAPQAEAPQAEAPKAEAPQAETPQTEEPKQE